MTQVQAEQPAPIATGDMRHIARYGAEPERADLAARSDTPPELLFFLGADRAPAVRARVAANRATPPQADRVLARDEDPAVRAVLARRIAALAPRLGPEVTDRLLRMAWETLCLLAEDAVAAVRVAIAETLADMPDAPRDLILRLARDMTPPVAEPVIRLSPLLSDSDLLALIFTPPAEFTRSAVARRRGLSAVLSDALVQTEDEAAIAALLENSAATIRNATLDHLIERAARRLDWQAALVRRPLLSPGAMRALAAIIADEWVGTLATRGDLDVATATALRDRLASRVAREPERADGASGLDEAAFIRAAARLDAQACIRALAERAGVAETVVRRAARLRSAKALISLAWRARYSPHVVVPVQTAVGGIPSEVALRAGESGGWPLSTEEMRWQVELLAGA